MTSNVIHDSRFTLEAGDGKRESTLMSVGELLAKEFPPGDWLLYESLPSGGTSLLVAKPKVGKSTLARSLALAVARGESFLGRDVKRGPVLFYAIEEHPRQMQLKFQSLGALPEDPIYLHIGPMGTDPLSELRREIETHRPQLAVIDPFFRFLRVRDANDYMQVTAAIERLGALARDTNCHVMGVHHASKGERDGADGVLGSTAIFAGVDALFMMRMARDVRSFFSKQRYGENFPPTELLMDDESGHVDVGRSRSETLFAKVLTAIGEGELTEDEIRDVVGGNRKNTGEALRQMHHAGRLGRSGSGVRGNPFRFSVTTA